ncbi:hypothetical protein BV898_06192 [Hypsibius exemplaris]|uniref:Uncharacterized protein n=1 Tax=Hypsibius exemplaris TaxID=2072580 RepID=A0A1W0WXK3_HYPEX|nr:hypothetical protein BV898_06192 [Hypsibius exemplaris]
MYQGVLVPPMVLTLWSLTGFLPYPVRVPAGTVCHRNVKWALRIHPLIIFLLYGYFYAVEVVVFSQTYYDDLIELEFFTMVLLVYREYFYLMPFVVLALLFVNRHRFPTLLKTAEAAIGDIIDDRQRKVVQMFHYATWTVMGAILIVSGVFNYFGFQFMVKSINEVVPGTEWSSMHPMPLVPGGLVSYRFMCWLYTIAFGYATLCWSVPTSLVMGLAVALRQGFINGAQELEKISQASLAKYGDVFETSERIAAVREDHRRLRGVIAEINATVAFVTVLSTLGDIIMPISIISRFLQDDSANFEAKLQNNSQAYVAYFFAVCAVIQCIIRISIFVSMHEQVCLVNLPVKYYSAFMICIDAWFFDIMGNDG